MPALHHRQDPRRTTHPAVEPPPPTPSKPNKPTLRAACPTAHRGCSPTPPTTPTAPCPTPTAPAASPARQVADERSACTTNAAAAVRVTSHQFRHTLGTRLINAGVPQHVMQRVLGHASPRDDRPSTPTSTTTPSATPSSATRPPASTSPASVLDFDPAAPTADAEWVKHNLNKIHASPPQRLLRAATPTGLPAPQRLPHLPRLPDHRRVPRHPPPPRQLHHRADRRRRSQRNQRLAANHRRVHDNLTRIIATLETVAATDDHRHRP